MAIGLVYDRANKDAYDMLVAAAGDVVSGDDLASVITTDIFPTILKKVGDVITRPDVADRRYSKFKIPLTEYGALTEYLISNMVRAADPSPITNGTVIQDMVVNNPDIRALYATHQTRANYPLTVNSDLWLDAVDKGNSSAMAAMIAIAMQSLFDGVAHDHDSFIPALFGTLYEKSKASSKRMLPAFDGTNVEQYSKSVFATFNKAIRDLTQWRRPDFNYPGAEMVDSKEDLVLVAFDNNIMTGLDQTILDVITSQINLGAMSRSTGLAASLGLGDVYEMPSMGIIPSTTARAYQIPALPGMQTADTQAGTYTKPYPNVMFALCGRGALNVGLKRLQNDTGRSIRGHFDQTWVQPTLELAAGAGQVIFFSVPAEEDGE